MTGETDAKRLPLVVAFMLGMYLCLASILPLRAITILMNADDLSASSYAAYGRFRNTADVPWQDGWGITYSGAQGLTLAFGHLVWLLAGGLLVLLATGRLMWVGFAALFVWMVHWTANAFYMQVILGSPTPEGIPHAAGLVLLGAGAWIMWRKQRTIGVG